MAADNTTKSRGRPIANGGPDIRQAILESAEALFARQGYAATSLRQIADTVDVNPAMIHYYFGDKRALLRQVLELTMEPLAAAIAKMKSAGRAPPTGIIALLLKTFSDHPNLPFLVAREVMLPGGVMQAHFLEYLAPRLGGSVPDLLAREQSEGRMRQQLDPRICTLIMLSLCAFPFVARELAEPGLGVSYDSKGMKDLQIHISILLEKGFSS